MAFKSHKVTKNEIDDVVNNYLKNPENFGLSIGIISGDNEQFYCFGSSDKKNGLSIDSNSVFEIGSITKVFTSIILASEVGKNKLKLNESIFSYLPEIEKREDVSLLNLATHSSGLPRLADNFAASIKDPANPYINYSDKELYSYLKKHKLKSSPGTHYEYSNVGVGLLGSILAKVNHTSYDKLVSTRVTLPFGLSNTSINLNEYQKKHLAYGHSNKRIVSNWDFLDATQGQGALRSSIKDMVLFMKLNLFPEKSTYKEAIQLTQKVHFTDKSNGRKMGLGWHIGNFNEEIYLEHTGGTGGYRSFIGLIPGSKLGVVILSNSDNDVSDLGISILKIVKNQTDKEL